MQGIVGAGLVGDHVRTHSSLHQFGHHIRRIGAQGNRYGLTFAGIFFDTHQRVIKRRRLFIDITGAQAEIDTALLTFNVQGTGASQRRRQWLRAPMPPSPAVNTQRPRRLPS